MLIEIAPAAGEAALELFAPLSFHLSIAAVLAGSMPGRLFVDSAASPSAALICSPEGNYLAARAPSADLAAAARAALERALPAEAEEIMFFLDPAPWQPYLGQLFRGGPHDAFPRRYYAIDDLSGCAAPAPPPGMRLAPIDAALLEASGLRNHAHMRGWAQGNWGSAEQFLARGFGHALVDGQTIVSWSLADSLVGDRAEIGIHTDPEYRRRGHATCVVRANLALAARRGLRSVGWHCGESNLGSRGVAERAGMTLRHQMLIFYGPRRAASTQL